MPCVEVDVNLGRAVLNQLSLELVPWRNLSALSMHETDMCDEVLVMVRRDAAERWSVLLTTLLQPSRGPHGPKSMSMSAVRLKSFMPLVSA